MPSLTLFFIVEPPRYQYMACYLAASIRRHLPPDIELRGYCPQHRLDEIDPDVVETLKRMRCDLHGFVTEGQFEPAYPHGNKILAAMESRETAFSGFMDSDILLVRDNNPEILMREGHVSASVAASMRWAEQSIWTDIYGACGLDLPEERITLMRDKREQVLPYFSSGFVIFPEGPGPTGERFPNIWMDTAKQIDTLDLPPKRPYLDQMILPLAIRRAGLSWHELPEEQHYILGGSLRGKPLPENKTIYTVHYRKWEVLKEVGLAEHGYRSLRQMAGARRVSDVPAKPIPETAVPAAPTPAAASTAPPPPETTKPVLPSKLAIPMHDPSKARMAAVTMVQTPQDYELLAHWLRYWSGQIGQENLYILGLGNDQEWRRIATGANVVHIPDPGGSVETKARHWAALSHYVSGLTLYYNWVICTGADEFLVLDPAIGHSLPDYLDSKFTSPGRGAPHAVAPFGLELMLGDTTGGTLAAETTLLSRHRLVRVSSDATRACITRVRIGFSSDGRGSTVRGTHFDDHLFLLRLRRAMPGGDAQNGSTPVALSETDPVNFIDSRQAMKKGYTKTEAEGWTFGAADDAKLYRLPDRFAGLF